MDMPDFVIAIPTYNRPQKLIRQTLKLLIEKYTIDIDLIFIFVENKEQYNLYYDALQTSKYKQYEPTYVITNTEGIGHKRNYIRNYFPDNTKVVMMDDDIEKILFLEEGNGLNERQERASNKSVELEDLWSMINLNFITAEEEGCSMWGVCLFDNAYFMKKEHSINLKYIGGTLQGIIVNDISKNIRVDINQFEDYEFSILHFIKEGKCLRFNNIGLVSKYYSEDGGICSHSGGLEKRMEEAYENATYLLLEYPNFLNIYEKANGVINIKLNHMAKLETV
tara:strand:+ start:846 stop:1685 length:840 start_codon:yes stop_codon:yes gene_type:complete